VLGMLAAASGRGRFDAIGPPPPKAAPASY
jgi:hypothetical protein